ncbi:MAG: co-chaperone YbbN [Corynebacterium urealyticum]|uniref:Co-chaperone YbbN n=1 Tax=Corynebacterium urealyticum TaxID=43771 RepID=A0A2W5AXX6_9CORY|nr:MAG: co-chaperone YbbN [Corynebacterium urealyticum]
MEGMTVPHDPSSQPPSRPQSGAPQAQPSSPQQPQAPQRFVSGAIDLGTVKQQAVQRERHAQQAAEAGVSVDYVARSADVTPESFEQDLVVRSTQVPVVLLVGSARSEASAELKNFFARLVEMPDVPQEQLKWVFRYIDADAVPEMAQALGVRGVPTVLALVAGRPATSFQGAQPQEQVEQWLESVIQAVDGKLPGLPADSGAAAEEQDSRLDEAAALIEQEKTQEAIAAYDAILADPNTDPELAATARAARANAILAERAGDPAAGEQALEKVAAEPGDVDAATAAAELLALRGEKAQGFEVLVNAMRHTAGEEKDRAKQQLLQLFELYDAADPEVIAARTNMASALF